MLVIGLGEDPPRRLEPVDVGHLDVHQHDVGMASADEVDRVAAVARFADYADARLLLEDRPESGSDQRLVVGDQDRDRAVRWVGSFGHGRTVSAGVAAARHPAGSPRDHPAG